jgi:hypothetical protein
MNKWASTDGSAIGRLPTERDGHDIDLRPGFDVDQPVALYHYFSAYPPTLRFRQFRGRDVPARTIRERGNPASI